MTCRDRLVQVIRAPGRSSTSYKAGLVLLPFNLFLFLLSFSSNHWLTSSTVYHLYGTNYTSRHQGLWRYCQESSGLQCCGYINDVISLHHHSVPPYVNATRAFLVIGLFTQVFCVILLFSSVFCCGTSYNDRSSNSITSLGGLLIIVSCFSTAFSVILSVTIYGGAYSDSDWTTQYSLSWSYAFCVISGFIYVVTGVIFVCDRCNEDGN